MSHETLKRALKRVRRACRDDEELFRGAVARYNSMTLEEREVFLSEVGYKSLLAVKCILSVLDSAADRDAVQPRV